jgi:hypothetical protein
VAYFVSNRKSLSIGGLASIHTNGRRDAVSAHDRAVDLAMALLLRDLARNWGEWMGGGIHVESKE